MTAARLICIASRYDPIANQVLLSSLKNFFHITGLEDGLVTTKQFILRRDATDCGDVRERIRLQGNNRNFRLCERCSS
jgi:hypothetical protein